LEASSKAGVVTMTVETRVDGSIRFRDGFVFLRRGLLVVSVVFVGLSGLAFASGSDQLRSAWGETIGALACTACAVLLEDSDFRFDAGAREVRWTKRRLWRTRGGTMGFSDVENVVLEVHSDRSDSGMTRTFDYRVFLVTRSGAMPLGNSNLDLATARDTVAIPLLRLLGKSCQRLVEDGVGYWVARGDIIRAETLAVNGLGLDSPAARKLVDEMRAPEAR
jgi:hypothetical protein